jgi:hypothetical protein
MMGSSTKVSLHPQREAQFSMTSEWYAKNRPGEPNRERHLQSWEWQGLTGETPSHLFTLSIPGSELRAIPPSENLSEVKWIPTIRAGEAADVQFFVAPRDAAELAARRTDHFATLEIDDRFSLVLLLVTGPMPEAASRLLEETRGLLREQAQNDGLVLNPEYRAAAIFEYRSNGVRGVFELVPAG